MPWFVLLIKTGHKSPRAHVKCIKCEINNWKDHTFTVLARLYLICQSCLNRFNLKILSQSSQLDLSLQHISLSYWIEKLWVSSNSFIFYFIFINSSNFIKTFQLKRGCLFICMLPFKEKQVLKSQLVLLFSSKNYFRKPFLSFSVEKKWQ